MKLIRITFAVTSLLICSSIKEGKAQQVTSAYDQLQSSKLISGFVAEPEPEKGEAGRAAANVRAGRKLDQHQHASNSANIGRTRSEIKPGSVHSETRQRPRFASFPAAFYGSAFQQRTIKEAYESRIEVIDAVQEPSGSWLERVLSKEYAGIDVQGISVLNQSPGTQHSFYSLDWSADGVLREVDFCNTTLCDTGSQTVRFSLLHEPAFGAIASVHFRDPGDTAHVTTHPLLNAQVDLFNLSFEKKNDQYPWPEFKLTTAPQLDLYGCFNGKDAQFQWPLQPGIEWHLRKTFSVVLQMSISLFTVGGRNPPPSFAIGILWHTEGKLPWVNYSH